MASTMDITLHSAIDIMIYGLHRIIKAGDGRVKDVQHVHSPPANATIVRAAYLSAFFGKSLGQCLYDCHTARNVTRLVTCKA